MNKQNGEKKSIIKRLLVGLLVLLLLAAIIVAAFNFDAIKRALSFSGGKSGSRTEVFYYSTNRDNTFAAVFDGLALASSSGIQYFNAQGEKLIAKSSPMQNPALSTNGEITAAFEVGGYKLHVFSREAILLSEEHDEMIVDVSVGDGGYFAITSQETGYKGSVTVYDLEREPAFKWFSGSGYVLCAALSPDNERVAVCSVDENGGKIVFLSTSSDSETGSFSCPGALLLDICFLDNNTLAVVGEQALYILDTAGQLIGSYDFNGQYLQNFSLDGEGVLTVHLSEGRAGTGGTILALNQNAELLGQLDVQEEVVNLSAAGKYTAVLYESELIIYNSNLSVYASSSGIAGADEALVRDDGTVILVSGYSASLFIP